MFTPLSLSRYLRPSLFAPYPFSLPRRPSLSANLQYLAFFSIGAVYFFWFVRSSIPTLGSCILWNWKQRTVHVSRYTPFLLRPPFSHDVQPSTFRCALLRFIFILSEGTERYATIGRQVANDSAIGRPLYILLRVNSLGAEQRSI